MDNMKMDQKFLNLIPEKDKEKIFNNYEMAVHELTEEHFRKTPKDDGPREPLLNSREFIGLAIKKAIKLSGVIIDGIDDFVKNFEEKNHENLFKISLKITAEKIRNIEKDNHSTSRVIKQDEPDYIKKTGIKKSKSRYDHWEDYGKLAANDRD